MGLLNAERNLVVCLPTFQDLFVFGLVDGGFQLASSLMGFEPFLIACRNNTEKIAALIERLEDFQVEVALKMVKAGAHGIIIADDFAYARNTLVSPQVLQFTLFPALKKAVQRLHQAGVPVFLHCDGNITTVLPALVATGLDGLQCLESAAGMDLKAIKEQWGDKLCLMGNLDISLLAGDADEASLREAVRRAVQAAAPGGGYIFSLGTYSHGKNGCGDYNPVGFQKLLIDDLHIVRDDTPAFPETTVTGNTGGELKPAKHQQLSFCSCFPGSFQSFFQEGGSVAPYPGTAGNSQAFNRLLQVCHDINPPSFRIILSQTGHGLKPKTCFA